MKQTDIKGRVQLDKAEEFLKSLKASRSRALSLGMMRYGAFQQSQKRILSANLTICLSCIADLHTGISNKDNTEQGF